MSAEDVVAPVFALEVLLKEPRNPDVSQPAEVLKAFFADLADFQDQQVALMTSGGARDGYPVACQGKGCSQCCYDASLVSLLEAYILLDALTTLPELTRLGVKYRLARWMEIHREEDALMPFFTSDEEFDPDPFVRKMVGVSARRDAPCPFLDDGACLVYAVRPFACRGHYILARTPGSSEVYTPDHCRRKLVDGIGLPTWDPMRLNLVIQEILEDQGIPAGEGSGELSMQMDRFLLIQNDEEYEYARALFAKHQDHAAMQSVAGGEWL